MKFYDRINEIARLRELKEQSYKDHSRLTVVTGRRRIGKTSLVAEAMKGEQYVYLFIGKKSEAVQCRGFCKEIADKLNIFVPEMTNFEDVFRFLMQTGTTRAFTLFIDEFQSFLEVNPTVFSDIQNWWDQYRKQSHVNFIVSGSVYSLMTLLFKNKKEPLYGRDDETLKLRPFTTSTLKEIIRDYNPDYTNDDLLALYSYTGGIPKYVEALADNNALTKSKMIEYICRQDSPFIDEGKKLLIQEFGKKYGTYFSVLQAISEGRNTQAEIEQYLNGKSIGGQLVKLEDTYEVIRKVRPILAKGKTQTVRYEIGDVFLRFWFRYIEGNQSLVEIGNYQVLKTILENDYATFSGKILEEYFKQKMAESHEYINIGSWWESGSSDNNEIDIVALKTEKNKAVAIECKRQRKNFRPELFARKVNALKNKVLFKYDIETKCLAIEDM